MLFWLFSFFLACTGEDYEILSPANKSEFITNTPEEFRVKFNVKPDSIILNGVEVIQFFEFNEYESWESGPDLKGLFIQGSNHSAVEPLKFGPRYTFFMDNKGPRVFLLEVPDESPMAVFGQLLHSSGSKSLLVNDYPVCVDNKGFFQAVVQPSSLYSFVAEDNLNQVLTTLYAARETIVRMQSKSGGCGAGYCQRYWIWGF